jgi:uncharacterized membrane protein
MTKQDVDTIYLSLAALVSFIHPIMLTMVGGAWLFMCFMYSREKPKDEKIL